VNGVVDLLAELQDPACYPDRPHAVEIVQTHISVVCLTDTRAYKLKKAVHLPFLDCREVVRRLHYCHEEVRLNRRLCHDVYLGVLVLVRTSQGLRFVPEPATGMLEPTVVMRRLPAELMLDKLLEGHGVEPARIEELARQVARFHAAAERGGEVARHGSPERLHELACANFTEIAGLPATGLPRALVLALERATHADFARILPVLERRAAAGHVVDGHGDLHTRNVCMTIPPTIYDCIEFEPAFRCGDVATEVAFLVMDLRYRGALELARTFLSAYVTASGDRELAQLMPALVCYRAVVRAKVAAITSSALELTAKDRQGARGSAVRHLRLAAIATLEQGPRQWWITCGPPASGKTTLCDLLAAGSGWDHISTDTVRKELAGIPKTRHADAAFYTREFSDRTYAEVLRRAGTSSAPVVLVDGNFPTAKRRAAAVAAARACGAVPLLLHCDVPRAVAEERIVRRSSDPDSVSDAGLAELHRLLAAFEPPAEHEAKLCRVLGSGSPEDMLDGALAQALRSRVP